MLLQNLSYASTLAFCHLQPGEPADDVVPFLIPGKCGAGEQQKDSGCEDLPHGNRSGDWIRRRATRSHGKNLRDR
jgi:hypothetical protein